ncbi:hypothetical protein AB0952_33935 [Streptomyces caniferus]|uniref:hypothetical protein n=1 Tax=Streptomyces caniferus TaxID=285557 RepID=UPI00345527A3
MAWTDHVVQSTGLVKIYGALAVSGIDSCSVEGFGLDPVVDIGLEPGDGGLVVSGDSDDVRVRAVGQSASLARMSAYLQGDG